MVKAEGQRYFDEVETEFQRILEHDGGPHTITAGRAGRACRPASSSRARLQQPRRRRAASAAEEAAEFRRWLQRNVQAHRNPALRAVTLSFKRVGQAPGDATADQLDAVAELADRFSAGELRVTHDQNLLLPWVRAD